MAEGTHSLPPVPPCFCLLCCSHSSFVTFAPGAPVPSPVHSFLCFSCSYEIMDSARQNKRSRGDDEPSGTDPHLLGREVVSCVGCSAGLSSSSFAVLAECDGSPRSTSVCSHALCMSCFGLAHAERGANLNLCCRGQDCACYSRHWNMHTKNKRPRVWATLRRPPIHLPPAVV